MSNQMKKRKIIDYVKKYYNENKKSPSIKMISDDCNINNREIYDHFQNKKSLCEAAQVPYCEDESKRTSKAVQARKFKSKEKLNTPKKGYIRETLKEIDINVLNKFINNKSNENYYNAIDPLNDVIFNRVENLMKDNPGDREILYNLYNRVRFYIIDCLIDLKIIYDEYQFCVFIKYDKSEEKLFYITKGWDFDDLDGSLVKFKKDSLEKQYESHIKMMSEKEAKYFKQIRGKVN